MNARSGHASRSICPARRKPSRPRTREGPDQAVSRLDQQPDGKFAPIVIYGVDIIDKANVEFASNNIIAPLNAGGPGGGAGQRLDLRRTASPPTSVRTATPLQTLGSATSTIREESKTAPTARFTPMRRARLDIATHLMEAYAPRWLPGLESSRSISADSTNTAEPRN